MSNQNVKHFSHPHNLSPLTQEQAAVTSECRACHRIISEPFHGCSECKYYLHDECLKAPPSISHPSHPSHHLTLLPFSTYTSSRFICDACGMRGEAFVYNCSLCSFDLHTHCALSPKTIVHDKHPHKLQLVFDSKNRFKNLIFICDLCEGKVDENWLYYCSDCDFGTHLSCGLPDRWSKLQVPTKNDTTDSVKAQPKDPQSPKDHQPKADDKEVVDVKNDSLVTTPQPQAQKRDPRLENLSLLIDEVTEIQIKVAKLQNLLSKTCICYTSPQV
nr:PREDICTED: uncharacterized protein LOC108218287 isoform X1 [Daucus carota subsp. sativus]